MNKLFTKIAALALGAVMAVGVGVAIGASKSAEPVKAAGDTTITLDFSTAGITSFASGSVNQKLKYTYAKDTGSSNPTYTKASGESQYSLKLYASNYLCIEIDSTGASSYSSFYSIQVKATSKNNSTAGSGVYYKDSLTSTSLYTHSLKTSSFTDGEEVDVDGASKIYIKCGSGQYRMGKFVIKMNNASQTVTAVGTPTIDNTFVKNYTNVDTTTTWSTTGLDAQVTVSPAGTYSGNITYNFTPSTPFDYVTNSSSSLSITATAGGVTSQNALVINDMNVSLAKGMSIDNPLAPSEAISMVGTSTDTFANYYVHGIVSQVGSISSGALTYYINDTNSTSNQLEIYKGKYLNDADFTNDNILKVGNEVTVFGNLTYYSGGSIVEFATGSVVVEFTDPDATTYTTNYTLSTLSTKSIGVGETYTPVVKAIKDSDSSETTLSVGDYTLSTSDSSVATVNNETSVITAVAKGTATITVSKAKVVDHENDNTNVYESTTIELTVTGAIHAGTFNSFTGDIVGGEYVITNGVGGTAGVGNTLSNNRASITTISYTNGKIVTPSKADVWLFEASGDYWTIKNEETNKYLAFNGSDGQATFLATVTDYAKWTIAHSGAAFTFVNLGKTSKNYLRKNGTYGWASYAESTGDGPSLYKLEETPLAVSLESDKTILTSLVDEANLTAKAFSDVNKTKEIQGLSATDFTFTVGDSTILSVTAAGVVSALKSGTTTVTASINNVSASISIKVLYVTIDLVNDSSNIEMGSNGTFTYSWSSNDVPSSIEDVEWVSSDDDVIAIIDSEQGTYLAGDSGSSAEITVTIMDSETIYQATREFAVVDTIIAPDHISVAQGTSVVSYVGTNVQLTISVLGSDESLATNQNVSCVSSNTDILTVTDTGLISPKARGVATVTISDEGHLCDDYVVTVRVRNTVIGEAKVMGEIDATGYNSESDLLANDFYTAKNNYDNPTAATTNGAKDAANYIKLATSKAAGTLTVTYSESLITKVVIEGKRYSANKSDPTISGATADKSFTADDTTVVFTFTSATDSFTLSASSGNQFYVKKVYIYGPSSNESLGTDAQACYAFEETYMHLDDYDPGLHVGVDGNNWCKDNEHNYYGKNTNSGAKAHFNSLTLTQRQMFTSNAAFADAWARLQAWATANSESLDGSTQLAAGRIMPTVLLGGNETNTITIVVVISLISMTAVGGYFFIKRRKEN